MKHLQTSSELQETALLYAIGALPEGERRDYAKHLEEDGCDICLAETVEFQNAAQSLALGLQMEQPSAFVKERVLAHVRAEVRATSPDPRVAPRIDLTQRNAWYWAEKLVLVAAVVLMAITLTLNSGLRNQVETLTARIGELEGQTARDRATLVMLTSPETRVISLKGQGSTSQAKGKIFWSERDRVWKLYIEGLPQVPTNRSYQLWFVPQKGNPVSAQVFNTNPDGSVMLEISLPAEAMDLKVAAVTTEPAGGLPQPSGAFALLGGD
jgi:anti-sigma-K factor RskA